MDKLFEIKKIRSIWFETEDDAKKFIRDSIKKEIDPFIPYEYILRSFNRQPFYRKEESLPKYMEKNFTKLLNRYYFGTRFRKPVFRGSYIMTAQDLKVAQVSNILMERTDCRYPLINILAFRPLTYAEYGMLTLRYPETKPFVSAALGHSHEAIFHLLVGKFTGTHVKFNIEGYFADLYQRYTLVDYVVDRLVN